MMDYQLYLNNNIKRRQTGEIVPHTIWLSKDGRVVDQYKVMEINFMHYRGFITTEKAIEMLGYL